MGVKKLFKQVKHEAKKAAGGKLGKYVSYAAGSVPTQYERAKKSWKSKGGQHTRSKAVKVGRKILRAAGPTAVQLASAGAGAAAASYGGPVAGMAAREVVRKGGDVALQKGDKYLAGQGKRIDKKIAKDKTK